VIDARHGTAGTTIHLPGSGVTAIFDADWLPESRSGAVGGLLVGPGRGVGWCDASGGYEPVEVDDSVSTEELGRRMLSSLADAALREALAASLPAPLEVVGEGAVAMLLRSASAMSGNGNRPAAVIDTTGRTPALLSTMERLRDLGTLVLAAPAPIEDPALDLYPHIHRRGLRLIAIGAPRFGAGPFVLSGVPPAPARVVTGQPLPEADWYCVTAA
jgi:hypothetical protein